MSTDDRLTMALYQAEQSDTANRRRFDEDMDYIFTRAMECARDHHIHSSSAFPRFCPTCLDELHVTILTRDTVAAPTIVLFETDICAILRQLHHQHISQEGTSGPHVHGLLARIRRTIGREKFSEFVDGPWPARLKKSQKAT